MGLAKTVLIIDDEPDFRQLLAEVLRGKDWRVFEANEGDHGIEIAKAERPHIVLCDLLMPRCNGFQVCRTLRADESLRHTRIIVSSGRDFESDRQMALEAGADEYLTKPLDLGALLELMSRLARQSVVPQPATVTQPQLTTASPAYFKFWGVRGSIPTPGPGTVHYGGNTSCIEIRADGEIIILDAGSGLRLLGQQLVSEFEGQPIRLTILLSHTHWDHIQGLPFFMPVYQEKNNIRILGFEGARHSLQNVLSNQMEHPFFPVGLRDVPANVTIEELRDLAFEVGPVRVQATFANHPGICVGYRVMTSQGSLAFFPDNEPHIGHRRSPHAACNTEGTALAFARSQDQKLVEFLRDTDVLVMDSQYDSEEYRHHVGWGHGCADDVVSIAMQSNVRRLFLFHHDPNHDDAKVSSMLATARQQVEAHKSTLQVDAAREGDAFPFNSK